METTEQKKKNGAGIAPELAGLAAGCAHGTLALWAAECAERALPRFEGEFPADPRPRAALETCRLWAGGEIGIAAARQAASAAHAAAREAAAVPAAAAAARAAGHAAAAAHARGHALRAAQYALASLRWAGEDMEAIGAEGGWQLERLREMDAYR